MRVVSSWWSVVSKSVFCFALASIFLALGAHAQQAKKAYRTGFISPSSATVAAQNLEVFRSGLHDLGYVEGENIAVETRWAEGSAERFSELIAELVTLKVHVLVVGGAAGALAAKNAKITTPVVFTAVTDPLGSRRILLGQNSEGHEACGLTYRTTRKVRAGDQFENCGTDRPYDSTQRLSQS